MQKISFLLYALTFAAAAIASDNKIGLQKFTETVITNDPETRSILSELERSEYSKDLSLPSDHFVLGNRSQYGNEPSGPDSTHSITTTVTKPFNMLGSKIELSHSMNSNLDRNEQTSSITYEQSIVKNAFGKDYRTSEEVAQLTLEAEETEVLERFETKVETIINLYFDYQLALIAVGNSQKLLEDAEKLSSLVDRKARDSIASDIDKARANHQVLVRSAELDQHKNDLQRFEASIKSISGRVIVPKDQVNSKNDEKLGKLLNSKGDSEDLRLSTLAAKEKAAEKKVSLADRASLADLGVFVGAQRDNSTRFGSETNRDEMFVGLRLSIVLGEDSALAAKHKQAIFEKAKVGFDRQKYLLERQRDIDQLISLADHQLKSIEAGKKTLENAKKIASGEKNRYDKGRIELERLITAQNLVTSAQLNHLKQQINLRKTYVKWLSVTDKLIMGTSVIVPWNLLE